MFKSKCIREKSNVSLSKPQYKFDKPYFDPDIIREDLPFISPKAIDLFEKISELDKKDMEEHNKLFKHFIFCDVKSKLYGIHFLASCFLTYGYHLGYNSQQNLLTDEVLLKTKNNNFFLLCSLDVFGSPLRVNTKKNILKKFNERPENVHGKLSRFILMDAGFKEGIDLFDIKYIHLFEPSINEADLKQVIGRGTRTCGQKGLRFTPNVGWPLNVYIYDLTIPEKVRNHFLDEPTLFALYLKSLNIDIKEKIFGIDLQKVTIDYSVDFYLNKNIHEFRGQMEGGAKSMCYKVPEKECIVKQGCLFAKGTQRQYCRKGQRKTRKRGASLSLLNPSRGSSMSLTPSTRLSKHADSIPPIQKMSKEKLQEFIKEYFEHCKWGKVDIENNCGEDMIPDSFEEQTGGGIITYTPTQQFVSDYFKPSTFVKGMLLWHSVGTGKTCSAIAAATKNFELDGYTILWVTRSTLKSDIWKNMFDQICNESIRRQIEQGETIPDDHNKRMRMLSKSWSIRPLSYKQFTNLISQNNQYYHDLVKINGNEDPLRKTLLVIDEAHKLYGGGDLSSLERPDMKELKRAIMDSYIKSGDDSVRLLLMTATPITENPMELVQLLNLCKLPDEQMPETFSEFSQEYLNEEGIFTASGENRYANEINGIVSYLNREFDVRQFAQPKIEFVLGDLISSDLTNSISKEELKKIKNIKNIEIQNIKKNPYLNLSRKQLTSYLNKCNQFSKEKTKKKSSYSICVKDVTEMIKQLLKDLDEAKKELLEKYKDEFEEMKKNSSQNELTIYYQLLEKCKQKISNVKEIIGVAPFLETIERINGEINALRIELKTLKNTNPISEMIDKIQDKIYTKRVFIQKTKEDLKEFKADERARIREEKIQENAKEKEERVRVKALEDIEDLVRHGYVIDNERIKIILDEFNKNIERKLVEFD